MGIGAAAACIPFLLGVGACSAGGTVASGGHSQTPAQGAAATDRHGPPGVSSHVVLHSNTLASGMTERGVLVIENDSGRQIPAGCLRIEVQLVNAQVPLELHPTPFCPSATLSVGTTRLPFTLNGSQTVCQVPDGAFASATYCKPLLAGRYHTELYPGLNVPYPSDVQVQVVARS